MLLGQDKAMVQPMPDSYPRKITHSSFKYPHRWHARHSRAALSLQHSIKLKIKDSDRKLSFLSGKGMLQEGQLLLASSVNTQPGACVHLGRGWLFNSKNHRPNEILHKEIKRSKISMWDNTPVKVKERGSLKYWKKYLLLDNVKALEKIIVSFDMSAW